MECHKLDNDKQVFFYEQDFYVLSNFSAFSLEWCGHRFPTVEHVYHWLKFTDSDELQQAICDAPSAHEAFQIAQRNKDGLAQDWKGTCWMNPPYGREISAWVQKAYRSAKENGATVVCLLPARVDTRWWHDYCANGEVFFVRGRLKFGGAENSAPFPNAVVVFRPTVHDALKVGAGRTATLGHNMEIKTIRLVISQPQIASAPSEWDFFNDELVARSVESVRHLADRAWGLIGKPKEEIVQHLVVGEKQCQYCKAKADCPEFIKVAAEAIGMDFDAHPDEAETRIPDDNARLARLFLLLPLIEKWIEAVKEKVVRLTLDGTIGEAHGLKVVSGRRGNKAWDNPAEVEALMKEMRFKQDQMYSFSLVTPTAAEKVIAEANPRKWKKLAERIVQSEGKPTVVSVADKRQAISMKPADGFDLVGDAGSDLL